MQFIHRFKVFFTYVCILSLLVATQPGFAEEARRPDNKCGKKLIFSPKDTSAFVAQTVKLIAEKQKLLVGQGDEALAEQEDTLAQGDAKISPDQNGVPTMPNKWKGYSFVIGSMLFTTGALAYVQTLVPKDNVFMQNFVNLLLAQIVMVAVVAVGAPIVDRIRSSIRWLAFGLENNKSNAFNNPDVVALEARWHESQRLLSINAQWARDILTKFHRYIEQNLLAAFLTLYMIQNRGELSAHTLSEELQGMDLRSAGLRNYAIDMIALAAIKTKQYFPEMAPDDASLKRLVHLTLTDHVIRPEELIPDVLKQIKAHDPNWAMGKDSDFYLKLLQNWLVP